MYLLFVTTTEKIYFSEVYSKTMNNNNNYYCMYTTAMLINTGLSLRGGGRGFPPATKNVAPAYFHRKIEEK